MTVDAVEALQKAGTLDENCIAPALSAFFLRDDVEQFERVEARVRKTAGAPPERTIGQFYNHPLYIQALVQKIGVCLRQFPDSSRIQLVFSAHGLPMSLVEKGDPYPKQVQETVRLTCELGAQKYANWPRQHLLCYQSRVGPSKWLEPPFVETLERLGHGA